MEQILAIAVPVHEGPAAPKGAPVMYRTTPRKGVAPVSSSPRWQANVRAGNAQQAQATPTQSGIVSFASSYPASTAAGSEASAPYDLPGAEMHRTKFCELRGADTPDTS